MPVGFHLVRGVGLTIGEHMGMPADQFVDDPLRNIVDVESTLATFLGDTGVEDDLQQHITEFLAKVLIIARFDRFDRFVGLFHEVLDQTRVGLPGIPRTAPR